MIIVVCLSSHFISLRKLVFRGDDICRRFENVQSSRTTAAKYSEQTRRKLDLS